MQRPSGEGAAADSIPTSGGFCTQLGPGVLISKTGKHSPTSQGSRELSETQDVKVLCKL